MISAPTSGDSLDLTSYVHRSEAQNCYARHQGRLEVIKIVPIEGCRPADPTLMPSLPRSGRREQLSRLGAGDPHRSGEDTARRTRSLLGPVPGDPEGLRDAGSSDASRDGATVLAILTAVRYPMARRDSSRTGGCQYRDESGGPCDGGALYFQAVRDAGACRPDAKGRTSGNSSWA